MNNNLIVDYAASPSPAGAVRWTIGGCGGGSWNGAAGITSSFAATQPGTAVGYAEAAELFSTFPATFAGRPVDATAVLVRHTADGDAEPRPHGEPP